MPSSDHADDPILARSVGNYRVEKRIGAGAMGAVYRLKHKSLPHTYAALKVLKEGVAELRTMKARFAQEAFAAAALGGQRVARPLDLGVFDDGVSYIVMEYVEGRTLAEELSVSGPLPVLTSLRIAYRIADSMRIAHARGIVHRDLKPSNIMLTGGGPDPGVKLLDFGVAQVAGEFKVALTLEHSIIGSPGYMSPEAATGLPVDGRTDVFSLGVTLYLMLAGRLPFPPPLDREGVAALLAEPPPRIGAHRPAQLEPVPNRVQALVTWALAKERSERCTMEQLRDALLESLRELVPREAPSVEVEVEVERPDAPPPEEWDATLSLSLDPVAAEDLDRVREAARRFVVKRVPSRPAAATPLLAELQRRRVFRATVAYGVATFAVLQIAEPIMHALHWPDRVLTWIVLLLAAGFPLVVALAWIFDVREGRIERTPDAGGPGRAQVAVILASIGALAAAPGLVWYFGFRAPRESPVAVARSIAVLPFVDMSAQKDQEYFSDGLTEELLNLMSKVPGLQVAARTSAFAFKGKGEDMGLIAQKLHVASVLEGSVRKSGDRIRITTQLIDASNGYHLWSETYDRQLTDVFAVQDEIARAVVGALKLKLIQDLPKEGRTANTDAHNEYLLGREFFHRNNIDGFRRAQKAYRKAVDIDPAYAPAWAGLAVASYWTAEASESLATVLKGQDGAMAAAEKAIAIAPDLAEAYASRAFLLSAIRHDFASSRADFDRALSLDPDNAETLAACASSTLRPLGKLPEAIAMLRKAVERDPLNARTWSALGMILSANAKPGEYGPAREAMNRSLEISPEQSYTPIHLAVTYLREGKPAEALIASERSATNIFRLQGVALAQHDLGHDAEAHKALDELTTRFGFQAAYQVAQVYAWWGDKDRAVEWLSRAVEQRDGGAALAKVDPLMVKLRGDPRYEEILRKLNLPLD